MEYSEITNVDNFNRLYSMVSPLLDDKQWVSVQTLRAKNWSRIVQYEEVLIFEIWPQMPEVIKHVGTDHLLSVCANPIVTESVQDYISHEKCLAAKLSPNEKAFRKFRRDSPPYSYLFFDKSLTFVITYEPPDLAIFSGPQDLLETMLGKSLEKAYDDFKEIVEAYNFLGSVLNGALITLTSYS